MVTEVLVEGSFVALACGVESAYVEEVVVRNCYAAEALVVRVVVVGGVVVDAYGVIYLVGYCFHCQVHLLVLAVVLSSCVDLVLNLPC